MYKFVCYILFFFFTKATLIAQQKIYTDVLVIGGGASGITAGLQSARLGVKTMIVEETNWLGGMITAAGVAAFDGNHHMPSGIWAEFREQIYKAYGGANKVATGWVSNTLFEPHVGDSIFKALANKEKNLSIIYRAAFKKCLLKDKQVIGAEFEEKKTNKTFIVYSKQIIDATELGDVMANAKIPFDVGMEVKSQTGENVNVVENNDIIQDLTYVAILKNYGKDVDRTIPKPIDYNPWEFDGCCNEFYSNKEKITSNVTAQKMLDYGKLPNNKYMINWPGKGNDIYLNIIHLTTQQRQEELKKAKAKTLRFLYFLQTQFGFKNLDLANDEFDTEDKLPLIPYYRESRRLQGMVRFKAQHIANVYHFNYYKTGIAVGDYPIDHHHRENINTPKNLHFPAIPSYNIPLGCLIPKQYTGIIIAEKSISVSNIVNGTTRLQPVVMLIGQAAGTLAAICVKNKIQPQQISVRTVQQTLLKTGGYLMPYFDVKPNHPQFISIQKIGASGLLKGKGQSFQWANRTWFYPDSTVDGNEFVKNFEQYKKIKVKVSSCITVEEAIRIINQTQEPKKSTVINKEKWESLGLQNFDVERKITRAEFAVLLDKLLQVFEKPIDVNGNFK